MILRNKNTNWAEMYNANNQTVIIASEMILAHKLFYNTNKIIIGIPNNINKELILNIVNRLNASKVYLYIDKYTLSHILSTNVVNNVLETLEQQGIKVDFRIALSEENIGKDLIEQENENKKIA